MCKRLIYLSLFILVVCTVSTSQADLVGHWKLDDGSGTTVTDSSGNGNDGTIENNPTWIPGVSGLALEFHGLGAAGGGGDYINCGHSDSLDITGPTSIALWIRPGADDPEGNGTETAPMAKAMDGMSPSWSFQVRYGWGSSQPYMAFTFNTSPRAWAYVGQNLEKDEWCHIACTFDGTTLTSYLNGEEKESTPMGPITSSPTPVLIGSDGWGCDWIGAIDDVRIYDHALSEPELLSAMEGELVLRAWGPIPADGALITGTWANISWKPGPKASSHDVYFSDNFNDVNQGAENAFIGNQGDLFLVVGFPGFPYPDGLVPGTTYYWRIDEVNEAEPNSPWIGDVWSFTIPPKTAYNPNPIDGGEAVDTDVRLSWTPGFGAKLHTVYFGETFDEVDNATGGSPQGTATYSPGTLKMAKTYYWRVDEFDVAETHKGNIWSFTTEGGVTAIDPVNGAVDVTQTPVLTWASGLGSSYDIYFGADAGALEKKAGGNLGSESYEPGQLE
ncbi:MAG: LamG domain-containing protein, partial [Sedimentisphaerales bacterium]|nr:LamG domain-containing protein [Sedimentisphaerales bacterium]